MKIIFSRKGFDSEGGGWPSPILPNGKMFSLPIPSRYSHARYAKICRNAGLPANLVEQLTHGKFKATRRAHLDPDLRRGSLRPRSKRWRPLFGQTGGAQKHLEKQGVGRGDLFLFFGWFRRTTLDNGAIRYERSAPHIHALFGWLQVAEKVCANKPCPKNLSWAKYHDHFRWGEGTLYVAKRYLDLPGLRTRKVPGGGVFDAFRQELRLTALGSSRSVWALPKWFWPKKGKSRLSYHGDMELWSKRKKHLILNTVARGQEFVLDADDYPEAIDWARKLIEGNTRPCLTNCGSISAPCGSLMNGRKSMAQKRVRTERFGDSGRDALLYYKLTPEKDKKKLKKVKKLLEKVGIKGG